MPRTVVAVAIAVVILGACSASSTAAKPSAPATTTTRPTPVPTTTAFTRATKPLAPKDGAYLFTLRSGATTRGYRLHVPRAAAGGRALPLVLNLHGATQNGFLQEAQSGMDASADRDGYLVAYPDGTRIATKLDPDPVAKDAQYGFDAGACGSSSGATSCPRRLDQGTRRVDAGLSEGYTYLITPIYPV